MIEKDYPRIFDFKKWVIDVAMEQINEHSDITVSYSQRKTGRTVTHLIFTLRSKATNKKLKERALSRSEIERLARPGETYEEAAERITQSKQLELLG